MLLKGGGGGGVFSSRARIHHPPEIPIPLCSWSNRFPWKRGLRSATLRACMRSRGFPRIRGSIKRNAGASRSDGSTVLRHEERETVVGNRPKRAPLFSLRLRTRIEHNEAAKGRAPSTQGINIARFLSLVVPPVSFQDLGNSYRQSRVISSIFSNVLEIFFFFFFVWFFYLLYTQVSLDWI